MHVDLYPHETCTLILFMELLRIDFLRGTCCVLIFVREPCCMLIFLFVKLVHRFFFSLNCFSVGDLLCVDFVHGTCWVLIIFRGAYFVLIFVLEISLHVDFSLHETCASIFLFVKLILFMDQIFYVTLVAY